MFTIRRDWDEVGSTVVLEALAHRRRRGVLRLLAPAKRLHFEDLVGYLSAAGRDQHRTLHPTDPRALRIELRHRHLPKLVAAGLVSWSGRFVAATDDSALQDPLLQDLLAVEAENWDAVLDCLANPIRRAALSALAGREGPMDVSVLARELAADDAVEQQDVDALARELHHVHLPRLARAHLVAIESGGTSIRYLGHPELESITDGGEPRPRHEIRH